MTENNDKTEDRDDQITTIKVGEYYVENDIQSYLGTNTLTVYGSSPTNWKIYVKDKTRFSIKRRPKEEAVKLLKENASFLFFCHALMILAMSFATWMWNTGSWQAAVRKLAFPFSKLPFIGIAFSNPVVDGVILLYPWVVLVATVFLEVISAILIADSIFNISKGRD